MIVIAHRGASAYRPEHTLAAYELAIAMGADFIEPDLVATRDGELVARHENDITQTTDVASRPEFAGRRATRTIDGREHDGWFTEDFTLAELRTLRATERIPDVRPANAAFDGRFTVPTLQEVIDLARRAQVGIYPETKHPAYFRSLGLALEDPLAAALTRNHLDRPDAPVFLQSFDPDSLRRLAALVDAPRVQLTAPSLPALALEDVAGYAQAIGPEKSQVSPALAGDAHRAGLLVHAWVFRPEDADTEAELRRFMELGVDGVFADHPDTAVAVREAWATDR
ncbi:MAG TPA: glycerophosphodiester phosphodiesterase family protein [Solirubrobacteraceae bacterium]|nr:glycerophosphodiester phosphodiesterase family protein [Solirubrobacteraceae bacterium]